MSDSEDHDVVGVSGVRLAGAAVRDLPNPLQQLVRLRNRVKAFMVPSEVPVVDRIDPLVFLRDFVAQNRPVLLRGMIDHWPALRRWSLSYLRQVVGTSSITVAVTPDGLGDAVKFCPEHGCRMFVKPEERRMSVAELCDVLQKRTALNGVAYAQKQNDSLRQEFASLCADVDVSLPWAQRVFGADDADAINLWLGNEQSTTSMHKDHYENLYCVVAGEKRFSLLPPTDVAFLHSQPFPQGVYRYVDGQWTVQREEGEVPWIPVDPDAPDVTTYPMSRYMTPPLHVTVRSGEMLYLPSLWLHKVQQHPDAEGKVIAVNYWYDMQFDFKWCYLRFLEDIARESQSRSD